MDIDGISIKMLEETVEKDDTVYVWLLDDGTLKKIPISKILELIHTLKKEVEEYEATFDIFNQRKYRKMFVEEWKEEYQKELDKQGEGVIAGFPDADYVYKRYFEQKAEIERLTEENEHLNKLLKEKRWEEFSFSKKIVAENAELQKQMDELKKEYNDLLHERQMAFMDGHQQAVKDTAKENIKILRDIQDRLIRGGWQGNWNFLINIACDEIRERYGVEVE